MWPAIAALGGAALGAAGSVFTNSQNVKLQRENQAWQERMANTAHQREVADLRAAGLNPILGYTKGLGGAATPTTQPAKVENPLQDVASNFSAVQAQQLGKERLELDKTLNAAQLADILAGIDVKYANANESRERAGLISNQSVLAAMDADPHKWAQGMRNLSTMEDVLKSQAEASRASAKLSTYQSQVRSPMEVLGKILESTLTGKGGDLSLPTLLRRIIGGGEADGAGAVRPPAAPHSAKRLHDAK